MFAILLALNIILPVKFSATFGYAAVDLDTGRTVSMNADERFPMGSVFKFPLALKVLQLVDQKKLDLDKSYTIQPSEFSPGYSPIRDEAHGKPVTMTLRELLIYDLGVSDNTAADYLMQLIGGPRVVTKHLRELGVRGISVNRSEKQMTADLHKKGGVDKYAVDPRDTAMPSAMVELLRLFYEKRDGLSPASHELAMKAMLETKTGANRIVSVLPAGATFAHKTGTMPGTVNDVGLITSPDGKHHIAIAVLVKKSDEPTEAVEKAIADIGRQILNILLPRAGGEGAAGG
jgi:beta-lactamase class A